MFNRITIADNEDCKLEMEHVPGIGYFTHIQVRHWTPERYKKIMVLWAKVLDIAEETGVKELHCLVPRDNEKRMKFAEMFGFEFCTQGTNMALGTLRV